MKDEDRQAVDERKRLIEDRARALAEQAVAAREPWTHRLGTPPVSRAERERWIEAMITIAAYRDRYGITSNQPVGEGVHNAAQQADRQMARYATRLATAVAGPAVPSAALAVGTPAISSL